MIHVPQIAIQERRMQMKDFLLVTFVKAWRVIFFVTGVVFMVSAVVYALPIISLSTVDIPWVFYFLQNHQGASLYDGRVILDGSQFATYIFLGVLLVPMLSKGGLHFFLVALNFSSTVYPDVYEKIIRRRMNSR